MKAVGSHLAFHNEGESVSVRLRGGCGEILVGGYGYFWLKVGEEQKVEDEHDDGMEATGEAKGNDEIVNDGERKCEAGAIVSEHLVEDLVEERIFAAHAKQTRAFHEPLHFDVHYFRQREETFRLRRYPAKQAGDEFPGAAQESEFV